MSFSAEKKDVFFNTKIKVYNENFKNCIHCNEKIFKDKNWEDRKDISSLELFKRKKFPSSYNTKADNVRNDSLKRAKDKVFDICYLNNFDYFLTVTFDDNIVNAADIPKVLKTTNKWLDNLVQRKNLQYILIPEYHKKNKRVHAHLLVKGELNLVSSGTYSHKTFKKPVKLKTLSHYNLDVSQCQEIYNISNWKYGFSTAIKTYGDNGAIAHYMTKYITKDLQKIFGKFYWSSRNIKRNVPTEYINTNYDDLQVKEFTNSMTNKRYKYNLIVK